MSTTCGSDPDLAYGRIYVLVEGSTDTLFVERVVMPAFKRERPNAVVQVLEYAARAPRWLRALLRSIEAQKADYVFVCDQDASVCKSSCKLKRQGTCDSLMSHRICVVDREIEAWYLAGVDSDACRELKMHFLPSTDGITKEDFAAMRPSRFSTNLDFMLSIVERFNLNHALDECRNRSLCYFIDRFCALPSRASPGVARTSQSF